MKNIKPAVLIDLDGVLRIGSNIAHGVKELFAFLNTNDIKTCIISNTTSSTAKSLSTFFNHNNIDLGKIKILTALDATYNYAKTNYKNISAYCEPEGMELLNTLKTKERPEAVIIGDMAEKWSYAIFNKMYNEIRQGAEIIAMHKNKFWKQGGTELVLDAGPFVAAMEYASDKEATIIGKPSPVFFEEALKFANANINSQFIMLGDDLETDIDAAQNLNGIGIALMTGKTDTNMLKNSKIKPKHIAQDLSIAIDILKKIIINN